MLRARGRWPEFNRSSGALMTSPETTAEDVVTEPTPATGEKPVIAPFSFPFKPSEFAQANKGQAWYQKGQKPGHHKTPGAAPAGTRRSMGKR
jgi:hypothetical protein